MSETQTTQTTVQQFLTKYFTKRNILVSCATLISGVLLYTFIKRKPNIHLRRIAKIKGCIDNTQQSSEKVLRSLKIQQKIDVYEDNFMMIFNYIQKLKDKESSTKEAFRNFFLPPFADGEFITELEPDHRLIYNKFNIYHNHLLVITKEFIAQTEKLNKQDLKQTLYAMKALNGLYYFNRGAFSGASQQHKHIQIFPNQARELPLFKKILEFVIEFKTTNSHRKGQKYAEIIQLPFFNFLHGVVPIFQTQNFQHLKKEVFYGYEILYEKLIQSTNRKDQKIQDYNVIGCEDFIFLVPRRKQKAFQQLSVNAVGFMGSVLFKDANLLKKFRNLSIKPSQILQDVTFPKKSEKHEN